MIAVTPTFNGLAIFGPAPYVQGRANEVARVTRGFVGVHGLLTKYQGSRGAIADAAGCLFGDTLADMLASEGLFEAYKLDGGAYTLVDTLGAAWPNMILVEFEPAGEVLQDPLGFCRQYRARFLGLTVPIF